MKRLSAFLLFVFLATLILAIPAPAADLQAGWYAWPMSVQVYADDGTGWPYLRASGWFTTPPGTYGPFTVSQGDYPQTLWRRATVTSDIYGVGPGDSLLLPMGFGMTIGERFMYIHVSWATDYDASQMRLELWRNGHGGTTERVWAQGLSGVRSGSVDMLYGGEFEGTFFYKVAVIPEPTSCLSLATMGLGLLMKRRKRR